MRVPQSRRPAPRPAAHVSELPRPELGGPELPGPELPGPELYATLADFRYLLRRFLAFSEDAAKEAGLTSRQHQALLAIKGAGAGRLSVGALAERLGIRHHSAVELVDRLAEAGLIRREQDAADRRRMLPVLTAEAESRLAALSATHLEELRRLRPVLVQVLDGLGGRADPS